MKKMMMMKKIVIIERDRQREKKGEKDREMEKERDTPLPNSIHRIFITSDTQAVKVHLLHRPCEGHASSRRNNQNLKSKGKKQCLEESKECSK